MDRNSNAALSGCAVVVLMFAAIGLVFTVIQTLKLIGGIQW